MPISISFVAAGAGVAGTTTLDIPYPAGILAGDMLVIAAASRSNTFGTIGGWTRETDSGSNGETDSGDTGTIFNQVFWKEAAGGETGTLPLVGLVTPSNVAVMLCYRKTGGTWSVADDEVDTSDASSGWYTGSNGVMSHAAGDILVAASAVNGNGINWSGAIIGGSGTMGATAVRADMSTSLGFDCRILVADTKVVSGSGSLWEFEMEPDAGSPIPAGCTIMLRLRAS